MFDGARQKRWQKWLLIFGVWTLIGLAFASQFNFTQARRGYLTTWTFALTTALCDWYVFALLSLPAIWLARRYRFEGDRWQRSLAVHLAASVVFAVAWILLRVTVEKFRVMAQMPVFHFYEMFRWTLEKSLLFNLLVYWVIIGVSHGFEYYQKYRDRELHAMELEKLLAQARLQALQSQLNPHFLFNTLHAISSLMHKDVEAADRMIVRLGELLRLALDKVNTQELPLRDELAFLDSYLEIEKARFGDRLSLHKTIAPETLDALVPNLVLQPLVENAIKHGVEPQARPGRIELRARREDSMLLLEVRDNGPGLPGKKVPEEGVGLSNTRARLKELYGGTHRLEFSHPDAGGLVVSLRVPFRPAPAESTPEAPA